MIPCPPDRVQAGCGGGYDKSAPTGSCGDLGMGLVGVGGTDETVGTGATTGIEVTAGIEGTVGTLGTGEVAFGGAEREGWLGVV